MRRSEYFGAALAGLLVVAAITVAAGSGRKPPKEQGANVSVRQLSGSEVMDILNKFPEMVPSYLAEQRSDTGLLRLLYPFKEVTSAQLERTFPGARFYQGLDRSRADVEYPYMIAISGGKRYVLPGKFNHLLLDGGQQVTDKNTVELAEAFVICAIGSGQYSSLPEITFLDVARAKLQAELPTEDAVILKVKTGERTEKWHLSVLRGQFEGAARVDEKGSIRDFPAVIVESLPGRGQLSPTPNMVIDTFPTNGDAYVEYDNVPDAHYYVIVKRNADSTCNKVVFSLTGFPPESTNVCVRVRDSIRHATRWLDTVQMGSGSGSDTWQPRVESTGICRASAGYDVGGTYVRVTDERELTPERVLEGAFPSADSETLRVYFCDQFFLGLSGGEPHATDFAQCVENAMNESWRTQVDTWGLGAPADADHKHQVFINDASNWYHAATGTATYEGLERKISVQSNLWYRSYNDSQYSSESIRVKSAVAHEFYHGIQCGLSSAKFHSDDWNWFTEAQSRFLQSAQYPDEEFREHRYYPRDANRYLASYMNTSLEALSNNSNTRGYPYCLFWRYMYERFGRDSGGIQLVRDCYAENVDTSNSIGRGKAAIDAVIARYRAGGLVPPGWDNFCRVLDQFAVACYLNDSAFNKWHPNPLGIYSPASLTLDSAFRVGPNKTDSIRLDDGIPCSFGIDLLQVALNWAAASGMLRRTLDRQGLEVIIGGNQGSNDGCNDYKEDRSIQGGAYA